VSVKLPCVDKVAGHSKGVKEKMLASEILGFENLRI
jgi:hypothetical protein